ncbi:hypothetical protein L195_g001973 [Trifolium pratense]|uniref:Uncharacterized protein n=1 Tax=Trifolium pratense TaxID=57577 RepID=A0A2K3NR64_TRIPR|nr:hypothetical protein L195_g001973 [Trifolium pratense]
MARNGTCGHGSLYGLKRLMLRNQKQPLSCNNCRNRFAPSEATAIGANGHQILMVFFTVRTAYLALQSRLQGAVIDTQTVAALKKAMED